MLCSGTAALQPLCMQQCRALGWAGFCVMVEHGQQETVRRKISAEQQGGICYSQCSRLRSAAHRWSCDTAAVALCTRSASVDPVMLGTATSP